jgi:hypothetical protein
MLSGHKNIFRLLYVDVSMKTSAKGVNKDSQKNNASDLGIRGIPNNSNI